MKRKIQETIEIPEGVSCKVENNYFECSKSGITLNQKFTNPKVDLVVSEKGITLSVEKANKTDKKVLNSYYAIILNLLNGLDKKYVYKLQAVNVHFPMTLKSDGKTLTISNFLGEKVPRTAKIVPNVDVDVKGQEITISSHYKDAAGQTATNFEKATKIKSRDRRIFQDGIYITSKPGEE